MKKTVIMAIMMVMMATANAMSYNNARNEALFLSDKMAYELNLTDRQYEAVYEINLDYMMSVCNGNDVFGVWWDRRNADLRHVLTISQYNKYASLSYFYRPLSLSSTGNWTFNVYSHYTNRSYFYKARPAAFLNYKGGNNRAKNTHYANMKLNKPILVPTAKKIPVDPKNDKTVGTKGRNAGNKRQTAMNDKGNKPTHFSHR